MRGRIGRRRFHPAALSLVAAAVLAVGAVTTTVVTLQRAAAPTPPDAPLAAPALGAHPIGFVDTPAETTLMATRVALTGWALAAAGVDRVEVQLDGLVLPARLGVPRPDVADIYIGVAGAGEAGFTFQHDFGNAVQGRHELVVVAVGRNGESREIGRRTLVAPERFERWQPLLDARPALAARTFWLLPATSGVPVKGADEMREAYAPYLSRTIRSGMRVPILYMRTTTGRDGDWKFDPAWDIDRRCGERRIADDSLQAAIDYAIVRQLPVMFTLNGGVWGDASCDEPDWDVNDELERDAQNCQWTARNTIPADTALRDLPGSQASPEIARALTLNVYASRVRHYKRRNLQDAAAVVRRFAEAHPHLFAGVSVDPDVYILPWFQGQEWFDYNPDTLRQFRHWLRGTGPYAGAGGEGVPDLSAYRRREPLSLQQVSRLAERPFAHWDDVDPPRTFPDTADRERQRDWNEPLRLLWDQFRRHLVHVHYTELAAWAIEGGIAEDKVFTAQAFTGPDPGYLAQPVGLDSAAADYDSGGVSVEGAIPRRGRLGVILYGENARNEAVMQTGESTFRIFERMAGEWGVVEFSTASLKRLAYRPTYADAYKAFREIANHGALFVSPMAWNGWNGLFADNPDYQPYTSWRNTPAERAALDLMVERANLPVGAKLWAFGTEVHEDDDGWSAEGARAIAKRGRWQLQPTGPVVTLASPPGQYVRAQRYDLAVLAMESGKTPQALTVEARIDGTNRWVSIARVVDPTSLSRTPAGLSIPLAWPDARLVADRVRITLRFAAPPEALAVDHVALYPAAPAPLPRAAVARTYNRTP